MDPEVLRLLKEIFYHVADAVDGGEKMPKHVEKAYLDAFGSKKFCDFYKKEVEARFEEV